VIYGSSFGFAVWGVSTLKVSLCAIGSGRGCEGYRGIGYNAMVNGPATLDDMQTAKRPLANLAKIAQLYYPFPRPSNWDQEQHFTWSNVNTTDSTPVCGSTYNYEGDKEIKQPFAGEIFCIRTDGVASTVWRFAHNRATYIYSYFQTQPVGSVSRDGRFLIFTSNWHGQLGLASDGTPDSAAFIVKLN
jgi:hypothetical protein